MLGLGTLGKGNELLWKLVSLLQQNMKPDPTVCRGTTHCD